MTSLLQRRKALFYGIIATTASPAAASFESLNLPTAARPLVIYQHDGYFYIRSALETPSMVVGSSIRIDQAVLVRATRSEMKR